MKRFIFKFCGGPLDGTTVAGELARQPEVRRYYALTHHGRLGQRFRTASEYAVNVLVDEKLQEDGAAQVPAARLRGRAAYQQWRRRHYRGRVRATGDALTHSCSVQSCKLPPDASSARTIALRACSSNGNDAAVHPPIAIAQPAESPFDVYWTPTVSQGFLASGSLSAEKIFADRILRFSSFQ